jgi:hypothetical protein
LSVFCLLNVPDPLPIFVHLTRDAISYRLEHAKFGERSGEILGSVRLRNATKAGLRVRALRDAKKVNAFALWNGRNDDFLHAFDCRALSS